MSGAMMGRKALGGKLFYQVSLEELVPDGHLLRRISEAVDFGVARRLTARFYSHTGQPSVDPMVLFKMALLGYLYGLPSARRLRRLPAEGPMLRHRQGPLRIEAG